MRYLSFDSQPVTYMVRVVSLIELQEQSVFMGMLPKVSVEWPGFIVVGVHENATMAAETIKIARQHLQTSALRALGLSAEEILNMQCKLTRHTYIYIYIYIYISYVR